MQSQIEEELPFKNFNDLKFYINYALREEEGGDYYITGVYSNDHIKPVIHNLDQLWYFVSECPTSSSNYFDVKKRFKDLFEYLGIDFIKSKIKASLVDLKATKEENVSLIYLLIVMSNFAKVDRDEVLNSSRASLEKLLILERSLKEVLSQNIRFSTLDVKSAINTIKFWIEQQCYQRELEATKSNLLILSRLASEHQPLIGENLINNIMLYTVGGNHYTTNYQKKQKQRLI